jgi:hypothetical protein
MARAKTKNAAEKGEGSTLGFEATLRAAAVDKLRGNLDAAESLEGKL